MTRVLIIGLLFLLSVLGGILIHEVRRPSPRVESASDPMTDIAARVRPAEVRPDESPARRVLQPPETGQRVAAPIVPVMPRLMADVHHPPQGTEPLALPPPPVPPDPAVPPPMAIDPDKHRHPDKP